MLQRVKIRALPVVNQASESVPMATACCSACRTCITTNIVGLILAGGAAATAAVWRFASRFAQPS